jgi:peptide/nickel transport system substrate-binding protein
MLVMLGMLSLAACRREPAQPPNALIYGRGEDAKTLDPINAETGESVKVIFNLYDTLVAYHDDELELVPAIATRWEHSEDGLNWKFHLRDDVRFHDGTPCDADAVVFSLERLIQDDNPHVHDLARPYQPSFRMIRSVRAEDAKTVVIELEGPSAIFLSNLAMFPASIVSPTAIKKAGRDFATNPVGTGPFRFERWMRDRQIVLAAFDGHWRGRPRLDRLIFVPVAENATRVQQIARGQIHLADNLPDVELDALADKPGVVIQEQVAMNVAYLAIQMEKPPLDNQQVRAAIWQAIDKQALARVAYAGHAQPAVTMVPPAMWGHHDGIVDRPFDPAAASSQIAAAARQDGFSLPLALNLAVMAQPRPYIQQPLQVAAFVKDALAEIGIDVTIDPKPVIQHFERVMRGDHQLALAGWTSDNSDPDNFLYSLLDLDNISEHGNNLSRYRSEPLHALLLAGQRELDEKKRLEIYRKAQEIVFADAPCVPLVHTQQRVAQRDTVKGYRLHPATMQRFRLAYLEDAP